MTYKTLRKHIQNPTKAYKTPLCCKLSGKQQQFFHCTMLSLYTKCQLHHCGRARACQAQKRWIMRLTGFRPRNPRNRPATGKRKRMKIQNVHLKK